MRDMIESRGAFETDQWHRLVVETARMWVIEWTLRTGELPPKETRYCYANGPHGFDWGNAPDSDGNIDRPLRGKRVKVTFEIEDV